MFLDACGAEVAAAHPPFVELAPHFHRLRSVFGYSSACVPSIFAGRPPQEHLHWGMFTLGEITGGIKVPTWLRTIPKALRDRGRVRGKLSPLVKRVNGYTGYFQLYQMPFEYLHLYGTTEPRDIFAPRGLNRGRSIFDLIDDLGIDARISDWRAGDPANWAAAMEDAADPRARFHFVYIAGLDGWLHVHTREDPSLPDRLEDYRRRILALVEELRRHHDRVNLYVFSDHGMCTVRNHIDVKSALDATGLTMHEDYRCILDATMARLWYGDDAQRAVLREALAAFPELHRCSEEELAAEGCAFPDRRFGDDIYLADPGTMIVPCHMGSKPMGGMHGYTPAHPDSDAMLLTNDPEARPTSIMGMHGLMARAAHAAA